LENRSTPNRFPLPKFLRQILDLLVGMTTSVAAAAFWLVGRLVTAQHNSGRI